MHLVHIDINFTPGGGQLVNQKNAAQGNVFAANLRMQKKDTPQSSRGVSKYDIHMPLRRQGAAQGQRKQQHDVHAVAGLGDGHRGLRRRHHRG